MSACILNSSSLSLAAGAHVRGRTRHPQATLEKGGGLLESAVGILSAGVLSGRVTNVITRQFKENEMEENNVNAGVKSLSG